MNRDKIKLTIEGLTFLVALFGVPGYFYSQHIQNQNEQKGRALEYVTQFQQGQILDSRLRLIQKWAQPKMLVILNHSPSNPVLEKLVSDMVLASPDLENDILRITNFFDTANKCVIAEICDSETTLKFLADHAADFCNLYGPYIIRLQDIRLIYETGNGMSQLAMHAAPPHRCDI